MSSSESPTSASTPSSSVTNTSGVLWVTVNLQDHAKRIGPKELEAWYDEHMDIVLSCPGQGDLFLRYRQIDPKVSLYASPGFETRGDEKTPEGVAKSGWVNLALVKLSDIHWLSSPQFDAMPRTSDTLPKHEDGSIGSAFTYMHAALRGYETVATGKGNSEGSMRPKWMVSLQIEDGSKEGLEKFAEDHAKAASCRRWIAYSLRDGLLGYSEPGYMPRGLVLLELDEKPDLGQEAGIVRRDVWELNVGRGDLSLGL